MHSPMSDSADIVHAVVQRSPQWLRHDFVSQDPALRARAEETIAAMIADALARVGTADHREPEPLG